MHKLTEPIQYISDQLLAQIAALCKTLPKVVVVGAGPAGLNLAKGLKGHADVTLVDGKGYHELNSGTLQTFITPHHGKKVLIDYRSIPDIGKVINGKVVSFHKGYVTVDNGAYTGQWDLEYDWLVLAPGSSYAEGPIKKFCSSTEERQAMIQQEHAKLAAAKTILVIGGGIVGVELAGEVVTKLPAKRVVVLTSGPRLIADKPPDIGARAKEFLERRGVEVHVNTRVTKSGEGEYVSTSGRVFRGDVVYMTVGGKPNTRFLEGGIIPLDAKGFIMVNEYLQVKGLHNVYAIGDATDVKETKLGYLAAGHGRLTALNLIQRFQEGDAAAQQAWIPFGGFEFLTGQAMLFTLGRADGVAQGWFTAWLTVMGPDGWFPGWLKAKEQYTTTTRRGLGLEEPEADGHPLVEVT